MKGFFPPFEAFVHSSIQMLFYSIKKNKLIKPLIKFYVKFINNPSCLKFFLGCGK